MAKTDFKTVDEYVSTFPEDVQAILNKVRGAIRKGAPGADEVISYQIGAFKQHGAIFHFAGWKQHYSLYPWTQSLLDTFGADLEPYEVGEKGTIRFPLDKPVPVRLITAMTRHRVQENIEAEAAKVAAKPASKKPAAKKPAAKSKKA